MPNLAFRVEAVRAERYAFEPLQQLAANMNLTIGRLERAGQAYSAGFIVKVDFSPPIASIEVRGTVHVAPASEEERGELERSASTGQPLPPLAVSIYAYVLPVVALLARELGLPPPVPMPFVEPERGRERPAPGAAIYV